MKFNRRIVQIGVALAATSLVITGCRGGSDESSESPGVTEKACPKAVNKDNGCIYLGTISDLTKGPFAPLAVPITAAQKAFWDRVNEDGGIDGYDIDVETYVRDNEYNPEIHNKMYQQIRGKVLGLAQTLGTSPTLAIIEDMRKDDMVGTPASWSSAWDFDDNILESGAPYCVESMNAIDWALTQRDDVKKVVAIGYPGDYGGDAAVGAEYAAKEKGLEFKKLETAPGQDNQAGAVAALLKEKPELVIISTGPAEMATIVGGTAAKGFTGTFIGTSPTWNPALLKSPAAPALEKLYFQSGPWGPWDTDTPGHKAMREAVGDVTPNDGYTAGWVWSYPLLAALKKAAEDGELNREGLTKAAADLDEVDYEGMLPDGAGAFKGDPNDVAFRQNVISKVDTKAPTGVSIVSEFAEGDTAKGYDYSKPCFSLS